tara:strand:- start:282 stop:707 length:426 start_codon:yes stop_codon:yes gene_type:complete
METHTTNIADLPIDTVPMDQELPESNTTSHNSMNHAMDPNIVSLKQIPQIHFNEEVLTRNYETKSQITITHKIIILAIFLFIIFNEVGIRNYIMNILVVIFGKHLRTENNIMSKSGMIFYGITYGIILYSITLLIDIESLF